MGTGKFNYLDKRTKFSSPTKQIIQNKQQEQLKKNKKRLLINDLRKYPQRQEFLLSGNSTAPIFLNGAVRSSATDICDFTLSRPETVRTPDKLSVCHSFKPCFLAS